MKWKKQILFLLLAALVLFLCWRTFGWYHSDREILNFLMQRYTINGQAITDGTYLYAQGAGLQSRTHFEVVTQDGAHHQITVYGYFRHNLIQIGPQRRILQVKLQDGTTLPS